MQLMCCVPLRLFQVYVLCLAWQQLAAGGLSWRWVTKSESSTSSARLGTGWVELAAATPAIHHLDDSDCDRWLFGSSFACVTAVVFFILLLLVAISCQGYKHIPVGVYLRQNGT